ncbi:MAG: undecaprenyldiphospho-muramoylpentapeptide beta-N-acetylglucosaminyltransferase [Candidatus Firestonebacteria bacterium RIFOXYC2_FULL_39_67]|nr:MAG: undecaprenyldiphospho-muramoylpentapeptide beta-N-acetylglucosaminyltransferase [Candidatus Firestonebacteria bacterium RIFOXYD2_FULL_39_29]OGF56122.1 MAG: undecaprenyldiphospho-muramoylpentapeptide beta-N-acetylglucosaminyltransferase [Candidatus Firestonebacteria bacterium RIFOXYC2_FULL_39_67]
MKILIATGGTGGHIYPAVAFGREAKKNHQVIFIGGRGGMEEKIAVAEGFQFLPIPVGKILRRITLKNVSNMFNFTKGIFAATAAIRKEKPAVIIGFGGYVCAPVVIAGWFTGIPVTLHEQNAIPGLTNKVLMRFARKVFASFPGTEKAFKGKGVYTGNPVREEIGSLTKEKASQSLNIEAERSVLSIIGGSQGARSMNAVVFEALKKLKGGKVEVLWMTGEKDFSLYKDKLSEIGGLKPKLSAFFGNIQEIYAVTDLLIARAGASTISEVIKCSIPSIFIPFPAAANNHQVHNARSMAEKGAALMFEEKDLTAEKLADEIERLLFKNEGMASIKENIKKIITKDSAKIMLEELKKAI